MYENRWYSIITNTCKAFQRACTPLFTRWYIFVVDFFNFISFTILSQITQTMQTMDLIRGNTSEYVLHNAKPPFFSYITCYQQLQQKNKTLLIMPFDSSEQTSSLRHILSRYDHSIEHYAFLLLGVFRQLISNVLLFFPYLLLLVFLFVVSFPFWFHFILLYVVLFSSSCHSLK